MFWNEITLLHFLVLPVSLGNLRVGLDFYQKLVGWLYNAFFALTAQAKITWWGYLIISSFMNLFVVFSSTAPCLATIPLDQGNSTAVAFIVMLNYPLSSEDINVKFSAIIRQYCLSGTSVQTTRSFSFYLTNDTTQYLVVWSMNNMQDLSVINLLLVNCNYIVKIPGHSCGLLYFKQLHSYRQWNSLFLIAQAWMGKVCDALSVHLAINFFLSYDYFQFFLYL